MQNDDVSELVRYENISINTCKEYMQECTAKVETAISVTLPETYAIVFDGQTSSDAHYVAVFPTFISKATCGHSKIYLA